MEPADVTMASAGDDVAAPPEQDGGARSRVERSAGDGVAAALPADRLPDIDVPAVPEDAECGVEPAGESHSLLPRLSRTLCGPQWWSKLNCFRD